MGQRAEGMITLGSQYYDVVDASIDYEWAVAVAFVSKACSLHHRLDICITGLLFFHHRIDPTRLRKEWVDRRASCFVRSRLHHRRYKLLRSSLALRL